MLEFASSPPQETSKAHIMTYHVSFCKFGFSISHGTTYGWETWPSQLHGHKSQPLTPMWSSPKYWILSLSPPSPPSPSGVSMAKWTTLESSCIGLSMSGSIQYTHFEFCDVKNHKHFENILIYEAKQVVLDFFLLKKCLHIFRRQCKKY